MNPLIRIKIMQILKQNFEKITIVLNIIKLKMNLKMMNVNQTMDVELKRKKKRTKKNPRKKDSCSCFVANDTVSSLHEDKLVSFSHY